MPEKKNEQALAKQVAEELHEMLKAAFAGQLDGRDDPIGLFANAPHYGGRRFHGGGRELLDDVRSGESGSGGSIQKQRETAAELAKARVEAEAAEEQRKRDEMLEKARRLRAPGSHL